MKTCKSCDASDSDTSVDVDEGRTAMQTAALVILALLLPILVLVDMVLFTVLVIPAALFLLAFASILSLSSAEVLIVLASVVLVRQACT